MVGVLKHESGVTKNVKVGFSWTTFFFGFWPALLRGDIKWAAIIFIAACMTGWLMFFLLPVYFVNAIVFGFVYNKIYINDLLLAGYKPVEENFKAALLAGGIPVQ